MISAIFCSICVANYYYEGVLSSTFIDLKNYNMMQCIKK